VGGHRLLSFRSGKSPVSLASIAANRNGRYHSLNNTKDGDV
jgi:hypothetical protein